MASSLAKQTHQRQSSRPNSASSSSIVTVQRVTQSRTGTRPNVPALRPHSPNDITFNPANLSVRNLSPDNRRRSSAVHNRPDSGLGVREGVGNLNRWSQSTVSSKSSSKDNRRSSFSKRLSGSLGSFGGFTSPQTPPPNGKSLRKLRTSPNSPENLSKSGPPLQPPPQLPPVLPPIVTLSSLSQAVDAAESPSTAATATPVTADLLSPANFPPDHDYFGDRWKGRASSNQQRTAAAARRTSSNLSPGTNSSLMRPSTGFTSPSTQQLVVSSDQVVSKYSRRASVQQKGRRRSHSGNSRQRRDSSSRNGTTDTDGSSLATINKHERDRKVPSQKAMLSKALQKANHAVLLDNAQNFEGAMDAYSDACALLQKVMLRSSGDDDRRKLEAVRTTYSNRISELRNTDLSYQSMDGKALPSRPGGRDSTDQEPLSSLTDEEEDTIAVSDTTAAARSDGNRQLGAEARHHQGMPKSHLAQVEIPPRRHSLQPPQSRLEPRSQLSRDARLRAQPHQQRGTILESTRPNLPAESLMEQEYIPPPLSPRRRPSPNPPSQDSSYPPLPRGSNESSTSSSHPERPRHVRQDTTESTSWLDTIDESGGSSASSVHSGTSSVGFRRKRIRAASGATEFDAAFDAAVEAAYDDGLEPANDLYSEGLAPQSVYQHEQPLDFVSDVRRNVELAKENVRQAEREAAIAAAKDLERNRLLKKVEARDSMDTDYSNDDEDEEERMMEEMTRDFILDSEYNVQTKSALPRQSDSSGFSGRTWGTSIGSNPTSAGTPLSAVGETPALPSMAAQLQIKQMLPPAYPPPSGALPPPPPSSTSSFHTNGNNPPIVPVARPSSLSNGNVPGVRERRLSGMKAAQLTIDTNTKMLSAPIAPAPKTQPPSLPTPLSTSSITEPPKSAFAASESQQAFPNLNLKPSSNTIATQASSLKSSSPLPRPSSAETTPHTAPSLATLHQVTSADSEDSVPSVPDSPARLVNKSSGGPGTLKKNFSSSSLKKILTASIPEPSDPSNPNMTTKQRRAPSTGIPSIPTTRGVNFIVEALPSGGIHLFDNDIHSPTSPGTPNHMAANAPLPLEPCPESTLLRPFWFLRCVYQSIAHPRGAYISTRLFVPRDIWKVTNVKLKNVEEKVSSCDLLTATLQKLQKVNTLDADAVLDEMQFLESVMEQSQANLAKRLGNEVGLTNGSWLSKGAGATADTAGNVEGFGSKSANASAVFSSWRKKMSKNSSTGPGFAAATTAPSSKDGNKEAPVMNSLPMASVQNTRFPRRDPGQIQYVGPNAHYMGALARLCEAAQILDQIARGVEDPGLKHSTPTHVGLELSARHAAEFFGFYICRFVFNDISMMLDKFIKRGSQWVLA